MVQDQYDDLTRCMKGVMTGAALSFTGVLSAFPHVCREVNISVYLGFSYGTDVVLSVDLIVKMTMLDVT
jgi:hypothetical protein